MARGPGMVSSSGIGRRVSRTLQASASTPGPSPRERERASRPRGGAGAPRAHSGCQLIRSRAGRVGRSDWGTARQMVARTRTGRSLATCRREPMTDPALPSSCAIRRACAPFASSQSGSTRLDAASASCWWAGHSPQQALATPRYSLPIASVRADEAMPGVASRPSRGAMPTAGARAVPSPNALVPERSPVSSTAPRFRCA